MRYSAATCDPNDFMADGFTLRQVHYDPPRRTELFIVITMHNADQKLSQTMHGVIRNIAHLCKRDNSKTWGQDGWKKVVVCIISDGGANVNQGTLFTLASMGCFQEDVAKLKIGRRDVTAHIYEYTTQSPVTPSPNPEASGHGVLPVQIIFCLKVKNEIGSDRWCFDAFGPILRPNVCLLLDIDTILGPTSLYHLWKAFDINSNDATIKGKDGVTVPVEGANVVDQDNSDDDGRF
jgi:chitin synthase